MWWIILPIIGTIILVAIICIIVSVVSRDDGYRSGDYISLTPRHERVGKLGERVANNHLVSLLKDDEYILTNLLIPLRNGHSTEIDTVIISRKGVFCVEIKNWVGHIIGSDEDEHWYQKYDDPYMANKKHRNPITQNDNHCDILEEVLKDEYQVDNVVIFVNLEDGSGIYSKYAFTLNQFNRYYRDLEEELVLSEVEDIYHKLLKYKVTPEELEKHKKDIQRMYN